VNPKAFCMREPEAERDGSGTRLRVITLGAGALVLAAVTAATATGHWPPDHLLADEPFRTLLALAGRS